MILGTEKYSESSDIFSCGLVFAEFYNLLPIFCGTSAIDQLYKYFTMLGNQDFLNWEEGMKLANFHGLKIPKNQTQRLEDHLVGASQMAID